MGEGQSRQVPIQTDFTRCERVNLASIFSISSLSALKVKLRGSAGAGMGLE